MCNLTTAQHQIGRAQMDGRYAGAEAEAAPARATVEQLQAPTSGTPHRVAAGGRSASIG